MARPLRLFIPGGVFHITQRGVNKGKIFKDDQDRNLFMSYLRCVELQAGAEVLAWCLMDNHFHLALRLAKISQSKIMQRLLTRYAVAFNRKYDRTGHLFTARFYDRPCLSERYFVALIRYIHMNPVKAGMVASPEQYAWSSMHDFAAVGKDGMLESFGDLPEFSDLDFETPLHIPEPERQSLLRPIEAESELTPFALIEQQCRETGLSQATMLSASKRRCVVDARRKIILEGFDNGMTSPELASALRVSLSTVSRVLTNRNDCKT